jgi:uncharacterized glyoxalase superfamily protein PhnB
MTIQSISAITLATHHMPRAVAFYRALGFILRYGGEEATFTSFHAGASYLNLVMTVPEKTWSWWGRIIFHVDDVDAFYRNALSQHLTPDSPPADATWGERYFHISDPDGHELSFASPVGRAQA